MRHGTRIGGVDFRGDEFTVELTGSGLLPTDPAYEVRNDRDELLVRVKQKVLDFDDAMVVFGPDEEPLFRWKNRGESSPMDRHTRWILYQETRDQPVGMLERPTKWKRRIWYLTVAGESVVLRRHLPRLTKLTVETESGNRLCTIKQQLVSHNYTVKNHRLALELKATLLMGLPLLRIAG